jgi:hypothetical protein
MRRPPKSKIRLLDLELTLSNAEYIRRLRLRFNGLFPERVENYPTPEIY